MTDEQLNNLSYIVYRWMFLEHHVPDNQLNIFAFIYKYSGDSEIASFSVLQQLLVSKTYTKFMLERDLRLLIHKGIIEEESDSQKNKFYKITDSILLQHPKF